MITIAKMARRTFLASALVVGASGEASAQTTNDLTPRRDATPSFFAVIAKAPVPYYRGQNFSVVSNTPPAGQFSADQHLCANFKLTWKGREFVKIMLPGGGGVYAVYSTDTFTPDPVNNQKCLATFTQYALEQSAAELAQSAPRSAPYVPPPVQRATQPAPNYATPSTAGSDPGLTNQMQVDIADITAFIPLFIADPYNASRYELSQHAYGLITQDPTARNIQTKITIAEAFKVRGLNLPHADWLHDDKTFNYLTIARRWFQMTLDQIKAEYPKPLRGPIRTPADMEAYRMGGLAVQAEQGLRDIPTALMRQQKLAAIEKENRDMIAQQKAAEAYSRTPEGRKQACLDHCSRVQMGCNSGNIFRHTLIGGNFAILSQQNCSAQNCVESCNQ